MQTNNQSQGGVMKNNFTYRRLQAYTVRYLERPRQRHVLGATGSDTCLTTARRIGTKVPLRDSSYVARVLPDRAA